MQAKDTIGRGYGDCWPAPLSLPTGKQTGFASRAETARRGGGDKSKTGAAVAQEAASGDSPGDVRADSSVQLLQRLLRGRAAQLRTYRSMEQRQGLVHELQAAGPSEAAVDLVQVDAQVGRAVFELLSMLCLDDPSAQIAELRKASGSRPELAGLGFSLAFR